MNPIHGHLWTIRPFISAKIRGIRPPASVHWTTSIEDPRYSQITLSGRLGPHGGADELLLVVHGLGGSEASFYMADAAHAAERAGMDCLRLNMRGADHSGEDYYHAALTADLHGALAADALADYKRVYVLGYSLGGHTSLRYATERRDPRVRAVAAICPPVDLARGAAEIDRPRSSIYRRHLLDGLKQIYREVARRRDVPLPLEEAMAIRTIRDWDEEIIAPRFGFAGAADYWAKATVGPLLSQIEIPALTISARHDPMVFDHSSRPALEGARNIRSLFTERGGHVGFPPDLDLNLGYSGRVEDQVMAWMKEAGRPE